MSELSNEQEELKSSITKSALTWGGVLALIAGAIAFWSTGDMDTGDRTQITGMVAGGVGFLMFWLVSRSKTKSSKCPKCSAAFSISRTNREETLISSEEKSEHEKLEGGGSKLTTWNEEKYDVVETYTCSSCGDVTTKISQTTRRKDEVVKEKAAPKGKGDDVVEKGFVAKAGFVGGVGATDMASGKDVSGAVPDAPKSDDLAPEKPAAGKAATKAKRAKAATKAASKTTPKTKGRSTGGKSSTGKAAAR
ncbi:hypothetical protein MNBD_ALPHA11-422, partial [hydrothermal vent metagenome]